MSEFEKKRTTALLPETIARHEKGLETPYCHAVSVHTLEDSKSAAGAGARCTISAGDTVESLLTSHKNVAESVNRTRQLFNAMPDFGKGISSLREWHRTETEKDDSIENSLNDESKDAGHRALPESLPAHDEASKQETELERAEAECYVLKEKLEITEQNNKTLEVKLMSLEAQMNNLQFQNEVAKDSKQREIDELKEKIKKLQERDKR